jgi:hypothetical protein
MVVCLCALTLECVVVQVIHVMAPNMNPQRNNCLHDDYTKGDRLLGQCYSTLLAEFWDLASGLESGEQAAGRRNDEEGEDEIEDVDDDDFDSVPPTIRKASVGETKKPAAPAPKSGNAFSMLMTSAKKSDTEPKVGKAAESAGAPKAAAAAKSFGWSDALTPFATHPGTMTPLLAPRLSSLSSS